MSAKRSARNGILSLAIKDKAVLYAAYMPFVRNGGQLIHGFEMEIEVRKQFREPRSAAEDEVR